MTLTELATNLKVGDLGHAQKHNEERARLNLLSRNASDISGLVGDGVTDNTVALEAAINASGPQQAIILAPGRYLFSHVTNPHAYEITLRGSGAPGRSTCRAAFGDGEWGVEALNHDHSTTLICTATDGIGIDARAAGSVQLQNLILKGYGDATRTTTGIAVGTLAHYPTPLRWRDVMIGNFAVGAQITACFEGLFDGLTLVGCDRGLVLDGCNALTFVHPEVSGCTTGVILKDCGLVGVYGGTCQGTLGTGFRLDHCYFCTLQDIWFETIAGQWSIDIINGDGGGVNNIINCRHASEHDNIHIGLNCGGNLIWRGAGHTIVLEGHENEIRDHGFIQILDTGKWNVHYRRTAVAGNSANYAPTAVFTNPAGGQSGLGISGGAWLMQSPNGTWFAVRVADDGTLSAVAT